MFVILRTGSRWFVVPGMLFSFILSVWPADVALLPVSGCHPLSETSPAMIILGSIDRSVDRSVDGQIDLPIYRSPNQRCYRSIACLPACVLARPPSRLIDGSAVHYLNGRIRHPPSPWASVAGSTAVFMINKSTNQLIRSKDFESMQTWESIAAGEKRRDASLF